MTLETEGMSNAYLTANVSQTGVDGVDTYDWEWGIDLAGGQGYYLIDQGQIQHQESEGTFALVAKIIDRIRSHK